MEEQLGNSLTHKMVAEKANQIMNIDISAYKQSIKDEISSQKDIYINDLKREEKEIMSVDQSKQEQLQNFEKQLLEIDAQFEQILGATEFPSDAKQSTLREYKEA